MYLGPYLRKGVLRILPCLTNRDSPILLRFKMAFRSRNGSRALTRNSRVATSLRPTSRRFGVQQRRDGVASASGRSLTSTPMLARMGTMIQLLQTLIAMKRTTRAAARRVPRRHRPPRSSARMPSAPVSATPISPPHLPDLSTSCTTAFGLSNSMLESVSSATLTADQEGLPLFHQEFVSTPSVRNNPWNNEFFLSMYT